jgi:hypothetical protein
MLKYLIACLRRRPIVVRLNIPYHRYVDATKTQASQRKVDMGKNGTFHPSTFVCTYPGIGNALLFSHERRGSGPMYFPIFKSFGFRRRSFVSKIASGSFTDSADPHGIPIFVLIRIGFVLGGCSSPFIHCCQSVVNSAIFGNRHKKPSVLCLQCAATADHSQIPARRTSKRWTSGKSPVVKAPSRQKICARIWPEGQSPISPLPSSAGLPEHQGRTARGQGYSRYQVLITKQQYWTPQKSVCELCCAGFL